MSLTGISFPSLPLSVPLQPWDIRHTISSEQSPTILLRALSIMQCSSAPPFQSIFMTLHPAISRACSRSSASATAWGLSPALKRISPYLLLFFWLCGMIYLALSWESCCMCSTVRASVSLILCIWSCCSAMWFEQKVYQQEAIYKNYEEKAFTHCNSGLFRTLRCERKCDISHSTAFHLNYWLQWKCCCQLCSVKQP